MVMTAEPLYGGEGRAASAEAVKDLLIAGVAAMTDGFLQFVELQARCIFFHDMAVEEIHTAIFRIEVLDGLIIFRDWRKLEEVSDHDDLDATEWLTASEGLLADHVHHLEGVSPYH